MRMDHGSTIRQLQRGTHKCWPCETVTRFLLGLLWRADHRSPRQHMHPALLGFGKAGRHYWVAESVDWSMT
jgi:hypothetical protein